MTQAHPFVHPFPSNELAPREATRYVTLMQPESTPPDDGRDCMPCLLFRLLLLLMLLLPSAIRYCACCRRYRQSSGESALAR